MCNCNIAQAIESRNLLLALGAVVEEAGEAGPAVRGVLLGVQDVPLPNLRERKTNKR